MSYCFNPLKRVFFSATRRVKCETATTTGFQSAKARLLLCDTFLAIADGWAQTFQSAKARLLLCDTRNRSRISSILAFQSAKARLLLCDVGNLESFFTRFVFQSAKARLLLCDSGLFKPSDTNCKASHWANPFFWVSQWPKHTTNSSLCAKVK